MQFKTSPIASATSPVSFLERVTLTEPSMTLPFVRVLEAIKGGSQATARLEYAIAKYRADRGSWDKKQRSDYKVANLSAFMPSGVFVGGRKAEHLQSHSGIVVLDLDDTGDADGIRDLVTADPYTAAAFVSPSGDGVKVFVPVYPVPMDSACHRVAFLSVQSHYEQYHAVDPSGKDVNRMCFLSHDAAAFDGWSEASSFDYTSELPKSTSTSPVLVNIDADGVVHPSAEELAEQYRRGLERSVREPVEKRGLARTDQLLDEMHDEPEAERVSDEQARRVLGFIDAAPYNTWISVGMACRVHGVSYAVWDLWSASAPNYAGKGDTTARWATFSLMPRGGEKTFGWGSVVRLAKENGYVAEQVSDPKPIVAVPSDESVTAVQSGVKRFFSGKRFVAPAVRDELLGDSRFWYVNESLHRYNADLGYYADCEQWLDREVRRLLERESTSARVREVYDAVKAESYDGVTSDGICLMNGVLDIKSLELRGHSADNYFLYGFPVNWVDESRASDADPFWSLLEQWYEPYNTESLQANFRSLVTATFEMIGSCFDGNSSEYQKGFLLTGAGNNGKSVLLDYIEHLLGKARVCRSGWTYFTSDLRFSSYELLNKAAALDDDVSTSRALDSQLKTLITSGSVRMEDKFKPAFAGKLTATFIGGINGQPAINDRGSAWWRRWLLLPFDADFTGREVREKTLLEPLLVQSAMDAVASTAIRMYAEVVKRGHFTEPLISKLRLESYQAESNNVVLFLEDAVERVDGASVSRLAFYNAYAAWCESNNQNVYQNRSFWRAVREAGIVCPDEKRRGLSGKPERVVLGVELV